MGLGAQPRLTIRELRERERERERARRVAETDEQKQKRLRLQRMTDWQLRPPKKEMRGWSVTGQDTGNNRLFSHSFLCFNSVPSKPRYVNVMQTGICYIGYTSMQAIVLVSKNHSSISYPSIL